MEIEPFFNGKKVFVTGDTGFKGSWLCLWLQKMGAKVYGYALPPRTAQDHYAKLNLGERIHHTDGDIRNLANLSSCLNDAHPDIIFHLAAQPLVLESYNSPRETIETNVMGTVNVLEAARRMPSVRVVINVTSDKCYHVNASTERLSEGHALGGADPYSASKACSELISKAYTHSFFTRSQCRLATVRAGNVIGPGDWSAHRIVPDFYRAVMNKTPLIIRNPGAVRPWQYVLDPLRGYLMLASRLWSEPDVFSGPWNFGPDDNEEYCVADLIDRLINISGSRPEIIRTTAENKPETSQLRLDCARAKTALGWRTLLDFNEAVTRTALGYQSDMENQDTTKSRLHNIEAYQNKALQVFSKEKV